MIVFIHSQPLQDLHVTHPAFTNMLIEVVYIIDVLPEDLIREKPGELYFGRTIRVRFKYSWIGVSEYSEKI